MCIGRAGQRTLGTRARASRVGPTGRSTGTRMAEDRMADVDSLLVAYADGELEPETIAEVESLLAANPHAAEKLQVFRETAALLRAACAEGFYGGPGSVITLPARSRARFECRWSWAVA